MKVKPFLNKSYYLFILYIPNQNLFTYELINFLNNTYSKFISNPLCVNPLWLILSFHVLLSLKY